MRNFCVKCNQPIKYKHRLLCDDCKIKQYRQLMKRKHEYVKKEVGTEEEIREETEV